MSLHNSEKSPSDFSRSSEFVRIYEDPDDDWCEMVNQAYGEAGYRTSLYCSGLLQQKISPEGVPLEHQFQVIHFSDKDGGADGRYLYGEFKRLLMGKGIGIYGDRFSDVPFAELTTAFDQETGEILAEAERTIRVPLTMMQSLVLEPGDET